MIPAAKKTNILVVFKPQVQLQTIPKKPDQYDHFQGLTYYTKSCSQKTDILADF